MQFRVAARRYLIECLFECDEGDLPGEALQTIAFINQISECKSVVLTEKRKDAEVDAVLNVRSQLRALAYYDAEDCSDDDGSMSFGSVDNVFILSETNYFHCNSEQHKDEPCSSTNTPKVADIDDWCSSESTRATHPVPEAEHSDSRLEEVLRKPCEKTKNSRDTPHYRDDLALENSVGTNHLNTSIHSKDISEICDGTSTTAHMLIGQILDKWLRIENGELEELTKHYLGGGIVYEDAGELLNVAEKKLACNIVVDAVECILPNLPRSCLDRVKRLMS